MSSRQFLPYQVSDEFRNQLISELHVELLSYGPVHSTGNADLDAEREGKKKNHCIIRVVFRQQTQEGFKGAQIRMDVAYEDLGEQEAYHHNNMAPENASFEAGQMFVKVVRFANQTKRAIISFRFDIRGNVTLGQLLDVAIGGSKPMYLFKFAIINDAYNGCRDWITQYFHQLVSAGYVSSSCAENPPRPLNSIIAKRYSPVGEGQPPRVNVRAVDKGFFLTYQRFIAPDMEYDR